MLAQRSSALRYPGGVPTSLKESGQQWDYPNAWPPLQHMLIDGRHRPQHISCKLEGHKWYLCVHPSVLFPGLSKVPSEEAKQLAFELAQRWIRSNWLAYTKHKAMFEKVSLVVRGAFGVYDDGDESRWLLL